MDINEYLLSSEVARRLDEARHAAQERALKSLVETPNSRLRAALGRALVAAGQALLEPAGPAPSSPQRMRPVETAVAGRHPDG